MMNQWKCPRCGQGTFAPKAYHCPVCKAQLTTEYGLVIKPDEFKRPDYNMVAEDEAPEYD